MFSKPPPYLPPEGQLPVLKGTVVSGEMQMEGEVELEEKKEPDVKIKRQQRKESEGFLPIDCYRQARIALEMMKQTRKAKQDMRKCMKK